LWPVNVYICRVLLGISQIIRDFSMEERLGNNGLEPEIHKKLLNKPSIHETSLLATLQTVMACVSERLITA
jgi:hypothetical protein